MIREVVTIDEDLCDGCGLCVPACEEGALRIVNGKAKLVADRLCDGMGACLGHCPRGAIRVERRHADAFDESAVQVHLAQVPSPAAAPGPPIGGCPGSRFMSFAQVPAPPAQQASGGPSQLCHWPVQLYLLSPEAPALRNAHLLVCADCVPFAYPDFHNRLLAGCALVIACPKLDDTSGYVEKLARIMQFNDLQAITVARMEVPCCMGIAMLVMEAREIAGTHTPVEEVIVGVRGDLLSQRSLTDASA